MPLKFPFILYNTNGDEIYKIFKIQYNGLVIKVDVKFLGLIGSEIETYTWNIRVFKSFFYESDFFIKINTIKQLPLPG